MTSPASVKKTVRQLAEEWIAYDPDPQSRSIIQDLLAQYNNDDDDDDTTTATDDDELTKLMTPRINFGTAGLRARMAPGYHNINQLVIVQTAQGVCEYIFAQIGEEEVKRRGVIVGYDGRYNSETFALLTAAVLLHRGVKVYLFPTITCTPMVPYGVLQLEAAVGVMVTASHNPKDDNGYKIYWSNGTQIIPPHDVGIADAIMRNLKPWVTPYDISNVRAHVEDPSYLVDRYMNTISDKYCWCRGDNETADTRVTYTAMHGVGAPFVTRALQAFNLPPYIPVKEQVEADPEFPTVAFPNPEEGKGALALGMQTAEAAGSRLLLANDPDADRLAVAERDSATGEWTIFNGNQIAALFADWVWQNYKKQQQAADNDNHKVAFMVASTVSSKFLKAMGEKEGFQFHDTLTGFKWIGNRASDLVHAGHHFLFAYEVEIGFVVGDTSYDKDGVRTAAIFNEMAHQLYKRQSSLVEHLEALYQRYGYFEMTASYYFAYTSDILDKVFHRLRTGGENGGYIRQCGPYKVVNIRDITTGYDSSQPNDKAILPTTPDAHMITYYMDNDCVMTLRNSGTEPKLKFYVEASDNESKQNARAKVDDMVKHLVADFLQPDTFNLIARKN